MGECDDRPSGLAETRELQRPRNVSLLLVCAEAVPDARVIYIALDNWPVHFHDYVQEHLAKMKKPNRIRFFSLPTYAPWTNPSEKYWLKLSREWLRFHPYTGDKKTFTRELDGWLTRHSAPPPSLKC